MTRNVKKSYIDKWHKIAFTISIHSDFYSDSGHVEHQSNVRYHCQPDVCRASTHQALSATRTPNSAHVFDVKVRKEKTCY